MSTRSYPLAVKRCAECGEAKPATDFYHYPPGTTNAQCIACCTAAIRAAVVNPSGTPAAVRGEQSDLFAATAPKIDPKADKAEQRALAKLTGDAVRIGDEIHGMRRTAEPLSLTIRTEVNNLAEVNDLLRHKLHEATLSRVIHSPPNRKNSPAE